MRGRPQTSSHLTVTDNDLRTSLESSKENLERVGHFASGREWGRES